MKSVNEDLNVATLLRWRGMTDRNLHSEVRAEIGAFFAGRTDNAEIKAIAAELAALADEHKRIGCANKEFTLRRHHTFNRLSGRAGWLWPMAVELVYTVL